MESLPPRVQGEAQGQFLLALNLNAVDQTCLPALLLQVVFWGGSSNRQPHLIDRPYTLLTYEVRASPAAFLEYLRDMGTLMLDFKSQYQSPALQANCSLDVSKVDPSHPVWCTCPINSGGDIVAKIEISASVVFPTWKGNAKACKKGDAPMMHPDEATVLDCFAEFDKALARCCIKNIENASDHSGLKGHIGRKLNRWQDLKALTIPSMTHSRPLSW